MLSIDQESGSRFDTPPIGLLRFQEPNQRPGGVDDLALLVFGVFTTLTTFVAFTPAAVVASALAAELERLVCSVKVPAESFTAALLHDVGEIVLCRHMQPEIMELLAEAQAEGGVDALHAEAEILEVHHGELGGLIAQHWELPEIIVTAITFHHNPEEVVDTHVQLVCDAVCVADAAAQTCATASVIPCPRPPLISDPGSDSA